MVIARRAAFPGGVLWLGSVIGCTRAVDPCPQGWSLLDDKCVLDHPVTPGDAETSDAETEPDQPASSDASEVGANGDEEDAGPDLDAAADEASVELDAAEDDASDSADASPDGQADADAGETTDTGPRPEADASPDARTDSDTGHAADTGPGPEADANSDAQADAGNPEPPLCLEHDISTWRDFHLSPRLVTEIGNCLASDSSCRNGSCLDECLRQSLGIESCAECVSEQVACVADACAQPCAASTDNEACRACACMHGCVAVFDTCGGGALDICTDCDENTCTNQSRLPVELIMVVIGQLLPALSADLLMTVLESP